MLSLKSSIYQSFMKKSLAFLFFVISFPYSLFALEPRCFTEYTEIAPQKSSPFFVTTEKDDIFFTQNSILIPSRIKQYVIRESFDYDMKSNLATFPIDATSKSFLTDDVNTTIINISPTDRDTSKDFTVTLTFKEKLLKNTFVPNIDIQSNENYILEISDDNQDFVLVNKSELVNFSFQSIRLIFQKTDSAKSDISFKTIRFNKLPRLTYLVSQNSSSPIMAYRGWICDE